MSFEKLQDDGNKQIVANDQVHEGEQMPNPDSEDALAPDGTPELAVMRERINYAELKTCADVWELARDLYASGDNASGRSVAEFADMITSQHTLEGDELDRYEVDRSILGKYEMACNNLKDVPIDDESEYERQLDHQIRSLGLGKSAVLLAMRGSRLSPDIQTKNERALRIARIPSVLQYRPPAEMEGDGSRELNEQELGVEIDNGALDQETRSVEGGGDIDSPRAPESKGGVISADVVGELERRMINEEFALETVATEQFNDALFDARELFEQEQTGAGKRPTHDRLARFTLEEFSQKDGGTGKTVAEQIIVAVANEIDQGGDGERLRYEWFDENDRDLNYLAPYVARALFARVKQLRERGSK